MSSRSQSPTSENVIDGKQVTGWRELVALPEWGIERVKTKIDTGARTSALHVEDIEELPNDRVRFHAILSRGKNPRRVEVEADLVRISRVRPSTGKHQERHVVATTVRLGPVEKVVEISLVCRQHMLCRMLLGRRALGDDFVVDPRKIYLFGWPKRLKKKRTSSTGERAPVET